MHIHSQEESLKCGQNELMTSYVVNSNCKTDKRIMPSIYYKAKTKLVKKIRHIAGDNAISSSNNLPPITFHPTHGDNVRLSQDGAVARRAVDSFCKGVVFSNRPIRINEKIFIKFVETTKNWSGVLRFGFTHVDPNTQKNSLPKYACPDLTSKPGYWAKALAERYADKDAVLFYYVSASGNVHFGINGKEKGVLFGGVDTRAPLWALLDIYGNTIGVEILGTDNSMRSLTQTNLQRLRVVHNKLHQDNV